MRWDEKGTMFYKTLNFYLEKQHHITICKESKTIAKILNFPKNNKVLIFLILLPFDTIYSTTIVVVQSHF